MGIIVIFNEDFGAEKLIDMIHLLMHADDILMLATTRFKAKEKRALVMISR